MANVEHSTMVSADVHEPKHISDTTSADAGKVITPLSGGSSELRYLTPSEVGVDFIYGEAAMDANTTSFGTTAASDPTLYTEADYVQLNSTRVPSVYFDQNSGVTFNATVNGLIPSVSGIYMVHVWLNVVSDTNNSKIGVKAKKDGVWCNFTLKQDVAAAGRVNNMSGHILTDLTAGNPVTIWLACDKTANLTVQDLRLSIEKFD